MSVLKFWAKAARALFAAAVAFLTGLSAVLVGDMSIGDLSDGQWVTLGLGALVAFGGVWGFTNPKV